MVQPPYAARSAAGTVCTMGVVADSPFTFNKVSLNVSGPSDAEVCVVIVDKGDLAAGQARMVKALCERRGCDDPDAFQRRDQSLVSQARRCVNNRV